MSAPSTALGADPDQLRGLARSLRTAASRLERTPVGLRRALGATAWTGPDANRFRSELADLDGNGIRAAVEAFGRCATLLDRQADQQLAASSDVDPGSAAPTGAPPSLPVREDRYTGALDARLGLAVLGGGRELTIAELDNGMRRVTVSGAGSLALAASAGASASFGVGGLSHVPAANGGGVAELRGRAGAIERVSWEVAPDRVDDLLALLGFRFAVSTALGALTGSVMPKSLSGYSVSLFDRVAGLVDRAIGRDPGVAARITPPEPTRIERLVEVELSTLAAAGAAGSGAGATAANAMRVGWAERGEDRSLVVETSGAATAAATSSLLRSVGATAPAPLYGATTTRWELPVSGPAAEGERNLSIRLTRTGAESTEDVLATVRLGDDIDLAGLARHLQSGNLDAAIDQIGHDIRSVQVRSETGTIDGTVGRASGQVAAGAGIGLTGRAQHTTIRR